MRDIQIPERVMEAMRWHQTARRRANKPVPCLCCWYDVYKFGKCLADNNWQLDNDAMLELMETLNDVYTVAASYRLPTGIHPTGLRLDRVLVLNDGIARTTDLSVSEEPALLAQYLVQLLHKHYLLSPFLERKDLGLRTVLAGGERIQYAPTGVDLHKSSITDTMLQDKEIDKIRTYNPAEFQMNVAFSRAYIIESAGHKYGIDSEWLYFDKSFVQVLDKCLPGCVDFEQGRHAGELWLTDGAKPLLTIVYDLEIELDSVHNLTTTVFRVSEYIIHVALGGKLIWFPLDFKRINAFQEAIAIDGIIDMRRPLPSWVTEIEDKWHQYAENRYLYTA